jgi:hypothetical protein
MRLKLSYDPLGRPGKLVLCAFDDFLLFLR